MSDEENTDAVDDVWADALNEQAETEAAGAASFNELKDESVAGSDVNLDVVLDIPVNLSMEIGRTRISIRNLLQLNQGSVVELERLAGEPMDVLVNGTLIARGEVVVVNENINAKTRQTVT